MFRSISFILVINISCVKTISSKGKSFKHELYRSLHPLGANSDNPKCLQNVTSLKYSWPKANFTLILSENCDK